MHNKRVKNEADLLHTLRFIAEAYQEISVIRMKKIRNAVVSARTFLNTMTEVFYDVKNTYKEGEKIKTAAPDKKKELVVLISANNKLYGDVTFKVFNLFMKYILDKDLDIMIVGRLGKFFFDQSVVKKPYLYFEIPESDITINDLHPAIFHLVKYEKVNVFYGQFSSIMNQDPTVSNISGDESLIETDAMKNKSNNPTEPTAFFFEPKREEILEFFQKQVFAVLFKQSVNEGHLAHFASRIKAMDTALNKMSIKTKLLKMEQRRVEKVIENRKTVERIAGITLWRRGV